MRVRVGCRFLYQSAIPIPMIMAIQPPPHYAHRLVEQYRTLRPHVPVHPYRDSFGNTIWRLVTPGGDLCITYDAVADVPPTPDPVLLDLPRTPIAQLPDGPRSPDRPRYAFRGGLSGAGASSTDSSIAANIERGF